jgi:hypothetical protein
VLMLKTNKLLAMAKDISDFHPIDFCHIVVNEVIF